MSRQTATTPDIRERLASYLSSKIGIEDLSILSVTPIAGAGLSRGVVKVDGKAGNGTAYSWIILLTPGASPVPPNRAAEFLAMQTLSKDPLLKIPYAYCSEESPELLGFPFLVTEHLPGNTEGRLLLEPEYAPVARDIVSESFSILGRLARIDAANIDLGPRIANPAPGDMHLAELAKHEAILRETGAIDRPVIAAALRHLHRTIPAPPERVVIVHGDFRLGNYLFDKSGVTGLIDWEMVHKGDPLEDVAWACLPNWHSVKRPGLIATCLSRDEVVTVWEEASGLKADPAALKWWMLLCQIKATAVRATIRHAFDTAKTKEVLMGMIGYGLPLEEKFLVGAWKECHL